MSQPQPNNTEVTHAPSPLMRLKRFHQMALSITLRGLWRQRLTNSLTILALGLCMTLPVGAFLFVDNLKGLVDSFGEPNQMTLYVHSHVSGEAAKARIQQLNHHPAVERVTYQTPDEALMEFREASHYNDWVNLLPTNPLPAVITVTPNTAHPATLQKLKQTWSTWPEIEQIDLDIEWAQKLNAGLKLAQALALSIMVGIGVGVLLVVGNTIRLALLQHANEIEVLNLIGATDAFIRRPFLYRGTIFGLLAGCVAIVMISLVSVYVAPKSQAFALLYQDILAFHGLTIQLDGVILFASGLLGWLGAKMAYTQQQLQPAASNLGASE